MAEPKKDVLVVGAGPVGLFTALCLARRGMEVEILDEDWRTAAHSYALALHPEALALLDEAGIAGGLLEKGRIVRKVALYDGAARRAEIDLGVLDMKYPHLLVLPQAALEGELERALAERGVRVRWNHRLARLDPASGGVVAWVERLGKVSSGYAAASTEWVVEGESTERAGFAVGADGHASVVRRDIGAVYEPVSAAQLFAVFEFEGAGDPGDEVRIVLDENSASVLWPLPGKRCRFSFEVTGGEVDLSDRAKSRVSVQVGSRSYPHLGRERLAELLAERAPWFGGGFSEVRWSLLVRFEGRLSDRFGKDHAWLAGDSAHMAGPVGVLSMNVGLREARDLSAALADGTPAAMSAYGAARKMEWRSLLGLEGGPTFRDDADGWVRDNAGRILACLPAAGKSRTSLAAQIGIVLP